MQTNALERECETMQTKCEKCMWECKHFCKHCANIANIAKERKFALFCIFLHYFCILLHTFAYFCILLYSLACFIRSLSKNIRFNVVYLL
jgi:hypothetical protein